MLTTMQKSKLVRSLGVVEEAAAPHVVFAPGVVVEVAAVGAVETVQAVDRVR